jgi:Ca2+-binding EF-hand superfamily protein
MLLDYGLDETKAAIVHDLMDDDGDGLVTFDEFWRWLQSGTKLAFEDSSKFPFLQSACEMFRQADLDGDGMVHAHEMREMLESWQARAPRLRSPPPARRTPPHCGRAPQLSPPHHAPDD